MLEIHMTNLMSKSTMVVPVNIQICKLNIENSINENIHGVPRNFEKKINVKFYKMHLNTVNDR